MKKYLLLLSLTTFSLLFLGGYLGGNVAYASFDLNPWPLQGTVNYVSDTVIDITGSTNWPNCSNFSYVQIYYDTTHYLGTHPTEGSCSNITGGIEITTNGYTLTNGTGYVIFVADAGLSYAIQTPYTVYTSATPTPTPSAPPIATASGGWNTFIYQKNLDAFSQCSVLQCSNTVYTGVGNRDKVCNDSSTYFQDGIMLKTNDCPVMPYEKDFAFVGIGGDYVPTLNTTIQQADIRLNFKTDYTLNDVSAYICNATGGIPYTISGCVLLQTLNIAPIASGEATWSIPSSTFTFDPHKLVPYAGGDTYALYLTIGGSQPAAYNLLVDSARIRFLTDIGTYWSTNLQSTPSATLTFQLPALSCGLFQWACDALTGTISYTINALISLFDPTHIDTSSLTATKDAFMAKAPFAYIAAASNVDFSTYTDNNTTNFTLAVMPSVAPDLTDVPQEWTYNMPSVLATPLSYWRTFMGLVLWIIFIFYWIGKARHLTEII